MRELEDLLYRFIIDIASVAVLLRKVYLPIHTKKEHIFTFVVLNIIIFLICYLLNSVELSMGAAFGLFAVFSMLRYRTEDIGIKDMTYLFLMISIGLVTAIAKLTGNMDELDFAYLAGINVLLILVVWILEKSTNAKFERVKLITFDKLELIHQSKKTELIADLRERTGLDVADVEIVKIDFVRNSASLKVYYSKENKPN